MDQQEDPRLTESDSDEEQNRERVCFVMARVEQETERIKPRPIKSEQVKLETVTNYIAATSNAKIIAKERKADNIEHAIAMVEAGKYQVVPFGGLPLPSRVVHAFCGA